MLLLNHAVMLFHVALLPLLLVFYYLIQVLELGSDSIRYDRIAMAVLALLLSFIQQHWSIPRDECWPISM